MKINPLPKPNVLVVIDNEEEPSIENVDKNKNVQNSKNNSTSNNKYNCNDTDLLIEELEKELLSLDNSETSDQKKIQSTNKVIFSQILKILNFNWIIISLKQLVTHL